MCGINGIIEKNESSVSKEFLLKMNQRINSRGPDGEGLWIHKNIGLAHKRLSVLDLTSAGAQPFLSQDQQVALVYNGEVYNFVELRNQLKNLGHVFKSQSDTEVVLHAYLEWGENAWTYFNGMFAFALVDLRSEKPVVYLVRDRFGIKPLFYSYKNQRLIFSSLANAFIGQPGVSNEISSQTVYNFLKFSHIPAPQSIFKDVIQLLPGHCLKFDSNHILIHHYANTQPRKQQIENRSELEWLEKVDLTLKNVVKRQILSDVPVGCFLSGGIDSSLLAYTYAELYSGPIQTFTICYQHQLNEGHFAAEVARHIGAKHTEIDVTAKDLINFIPQAAQFFDQPFADPTLLPSLILARETKKQVTVALSGDGGDELFFGYSYQKALLQNQWLLYTPQKIRETGALGLVKLAKLFKLRQFEQLNKLSDILSFKNKTEFLQYFIGTIGPLKLDRLALLMKNPIDLSTQPLKQLVESNSELEWPQQIEQLFIKTFLVDTVLTKTDRTGMAFGLEGRVPFLDDDMLQFSIDLPFDLKFKNGQSKYLLRELLDKKIPGHLARRPKQGFSIPIRDWFRNELAPFIKETLSEERLKIHNFFNAIEIKKIISEHFEHKANHSHLIFSIIMFQLWYEENFK